MRFEGTERGPFRREADMRGRCNDDDPTACGGCEVRVVA